MKELLLPILGLFLLTRVAKGQTTPDTSTPTTPTGPQRTSTGKVIAPWPETISSQKQFLDLWKYNAGYGNVNGVFVSLIGPATVCQWPRKFEYKQKINGLYYSLQSAINEYGQTTNDRRREELMDTIGNINTSIKQAYQALKNGCMTYVPGSSGAAVTTLTPGLQP
jgi:hypothetical protein